MVCVTGARGSPGGGHVDVESVGPDQELPLLAFGSEALSVSDLVGHGESHENWAPLL